MIFFLFIQKYYSQFRGYILFFFIAETVALI